MTGIGITERGDAGLDLIWTKSILPLNIIISKHLCLKNTKFIEAVMENKDKIILHVTCTGYGGTSMEPNVPKPKAVLEACNELLNRGFPVERMVLRIDPIFANAENGLNMIRKVLSMFKDTGIKRVRYSFCQMYNHVKKRFREMYGKVPYEDFYVNREATYAVYDIFEEFDYEYESCAANDANELGCISWKDLKIAGLPLENLEYGGQRRYCKCLSNKYELLASKYRCESKCIYCYWIDKEATEPFMFRGEYNFLSNFYGIDIEFAGGVFHSSEALYQVLRLEKTLKYFEEFQTLSPKEAKWRASSLRKREDQDTVAVMRGVLDLKFKDYVLALRLKSTRGELVENNTWHDNFWGNCYCDKCANIEGKNMLGKLLMEKREELWNEK